MSNIKIEETKHTWIENNAIVKVKHYGDSKVVHYNSNIQNHLCKYKKLNNKSCIDKQTGDIIMYNQNKEKVPKYVAREVSRAKDILISNFPKGQNVLFLTLTFSNPCTDFEITRKYFRYFLDKLKRRYGKIIYFYVIELQKERAEPSLHIHAAIKQTEKKRLVINNNEVERLWNKGFTKTKRLSNVQEISNYFFKDFFRKENLKIYTKNCHIYYHSIGLKTPKVEEMKMSNFINLYGEEYYMYNSITKNIIDSRTDKIMCTNINKVFKKRKYKIKHKKILKVKIPVRFIKVEDGKMICDDIYSFKKRCWKWYNVKISLDTQNTVLMSKVKKLKRKKKCWILLETTFPIRYGFSNSKIIDVEDTDTSIKNRLF